MFGKKDKAGITAWADALKPNTSITELNLAKNKINANDTKILAPAISDNGALTSLNLASNGIGGHKDGPFSSFIVTPEGTAALSPIVHTSCTVSHIAGDIRSCCYR
jgi:hypothetical protein